MTSDYLWLLLPALCWLDSVTACLRGESSAVSTESLPNGWLLGKHQRQVTQNQHKFTVCWQLTNTLGELAVANSSGWHQYSMPRAVSCSDAPKYPEWKKRALWPHISSEPCASKNQNATAQVWYPSGASSCQPWAVTMVRAVSNTCEWRPKGDVLWGWVWDWLGIWSTLKKIKTLKLGPVRATESSWRMV